MFTGSIVALVTPFTLDGTLDRHAFEKLLGFHLDAGTNGIVVGGTTGESPTITHQELIVLLEWAISFVAKQIPVIAGTGSNSTQKAIELTREAAKLGVDACLLVTPYYNKPTQEGLYRHYKALQDAVDIPQILYNVPSRTNCDLLPETVIRLSELPNIVGCKEATGDLQRVSILSESCNEKFILLSGDDATTKDFILLGGHGVISVTANCAPRIMKMMVAAAREGDLASSAFYNNQINDLHNYLFVESNPTPIKWVLSEMGLIQNVLRLPLLPLSQHHHTQLKNALTTAEIKTAL